jgi:molybdate transport system substrate-binding protein
MMSQRVRHFLFFKNVGGFIMRNFKNNMFCFILIFSLMVLSFGCDQNNSLFEAKTVNEEETIELMVSAAASLTEAMEGIKTVYGEERPNVNITYNLASSGSLQHQIEQGAEVDVFLSASTKQMDKLSEQELILEDSKKNFLENKIVLIEPIDSSRVIDFESLKTVEISKIGLGEPASVPVGQYADEVLKNLNIFDEIKDKVVYGKNVEEVLAWVETRNVDAGIVYQTDANVSSKIKVVVEAPEGTHKPIYYPAAIIKDCKNLVAAKEFIEFIYSDKAKPIFEKYGFVFIAK